MCLGCLVIAGCFPAQFALQPDPFDADSLDMGLVSTDAEHPVDARLTQDAQREGPIDLGNLTPDGGMDAEVLRDAYAEATLAHDAGGDLGSPVDGGAGPSTPTAPPSLVHTGTGGLVLRGVVLAPEGPIASGEVFVTGNTIRCVARSCAAEVGYDAATVVDTHGGVISPGLIDAHNHLAYDFLDEWVRPMPMIWGNRDEWVNDPSYEAHIAPYADDRSRADVFCPAAKWGELRALMHGTTTVQGQTFTQTCINIGVRNAESYHGLPNGPGGSSYDHLATTIASPRDINDTQAATYVSNFTAATNPVTRLVVHMQEGVSGTTFLTEFESFAGRDARVNRHMGLSLLSGTAMGVSYRETGYLIHAISLTDAQFMEARDAGASIVWSPSSNLALYGRTAPIARILELGINVALGPDWTVSGEDDMLGELRFSREFARVSHIRALSDQVLWRMSTENGARAVDLDPWIGALRVGHRADIAIFGRTAADPYSALIDSRDEEVRLVLIDGHAYYGDLALEALAVHGACDHVEVCGASKFVCVANLSPTRGTGSIAQGNETLEQIRMRLVARLATYGRSDLLPLSDCSVP